MVEAIVVVLEVIVAMVVSIAKEVMKLEIMVVIVVVDLAHKLLDEALDPESKAEDVGRGIYSGSPSRNSCACLALSLNFAALRPRWGQTPRRQGSTAQHPRKGSSSPTQAYQLTSTLSLIQA